MIIISILNCTNNTGEGESALSVSAFYGWLDCVKRLVETFGLDPKGELYNSTSRKRFRFSFNPIHKAEALLICLPEPTIIIDYNIYYRFKSMGVV